MTILAAQQRFLRRLRDEARTARLRAKVARAKALNYEQAATSLDAQADRECHGHPNRRSTMYQGSQERIECLDCGQIWWD